MSERSPRKLVRTVLTGIVSVAVTSCIVFIDEGPSSGEHCRFDGEETLCGTCVRERCQAAVDSCCGDASCNETLAMFEACAKQRDGICDELKKRQGELASCATNSCASVCRNFTGKSTTTCRDLPFGQGKTCSCTLANGAEGNDFDCSSVTHPRTLCCAPVGWPEGAGLTCTCRTLRCSSTPSGCSCYLSDSPGDESPCASSKCCVDGDNCGCRDRCFTTEREVPRCSLDVLIDGVPAIQCGRSEKRVESCSNRVP